MKLSDLEITRFINSDFEENLYVVRLRGAEECVVIDPGLEPEEAIDFIRKNKLTPKAILVTHGHYDHIGGLAAFKALWPNAPILIGEKDRDKLTDPMGNLSGHFGFPATAPRADRSLQDGERFEAAGLTFQTELIPGHSVGHVVYRHAAEDGEVVFVGDVIFQGSVGRTDFPDGCTSDLISGIKERLLTLPDRTLFYPGHGPATTPEVEKRTNPWIE